ncbi:hypothetical protein AXF42_Ash007063 [Apostasia shenzhenica]|uniref:HTH La-type RNA-binding domain-containing protein n=1 Tax=Apostasia shenzhenica TaxID=1088818 RepID=A0A2I0BF29_9ASPA|nr:hypothetical protein AXF42_Ash007063 [Apostasia shenzhenica]
MFHGSDGPASRDASSLPWFDCGETDSAGGVLTSPVVSLIASPGEGSEELGPSSREGNASDALALEFGKKAAWGRTPNGVASAPAEVIGGSESWPALSESAKSSTKPSSSDGSSSSLARSLKRGGGGEVSGRLSNYEVRKDAAISTPGTSTSSSTSDHEDRSRRYGNRREQERRGHSWNSSRSSSARGSHLQQGHMRPPAMSLIPPWMPNLPPWMIPSVNQMMPPPPPPLVPLVGPPPPFQPFPVPMVYTGEFLDLHPIVNCLPVVYLMNWLYGFLPNSSDLYQNPFFRPQPHPEFFRVSHYNPQPAPRPIRQTTPSALTEHQRTSLLRQIEYYFSPANLCKDPFLRLQMDEHGWVPIALIATFNKVKGITNNIPVILDALRSSEIVEIQGNQIRKREGWEQWIMDADLFDNNGESITSKIKNEEKN